MSDSEIVTCKGSVGDDEILKGIREKFETSFDIFMGNGTLASSLYIQPKLEHLSTNAEKERDTIDCDDLLNQILNSQCASYVILGDSGSGKTSLGLYICSHFWKNYENNSRKLGGMRIPIYIHLPVVVENLDENIFGSFFSTLDPQLVEKMCNKKLLIIVDGFDEMNESSAKNIYKINLWGFPPFMDTKMLILSRNERLSSDKAKIFAPGEDQEFKLFTIQPFIPAQIDAYIHQFDEFIRSTNALDLENTPWSLAKLEYAHGNWSKDEYLKWFRILPDLKCLAQTPLILSLILQTLPAVVSASQSKFEPALEHNLINRIKSFCNTKVSVYDEFIDQWFSYQYKRLEKSNQVENFTNIPQTVFKTYCYTFGQNLAFCLISRKKDNETCGLLLDRVMLTKETQNRKLIELVDYEKKMSKEDKSKFNKMFMNSSILFETLRKSCLVKSTVSNGETQFQFFHRSIAEYFVALDLFNGLQGEFNYYLDFNENSVETGVEIRGLNKYLLREDEIILGLADRLKPNEQDITESNNFKNLLFRIIKKSKELSIIAIMSSNSISILNIGGISFSGMDLSWVQIPGANLSHCLCGETDFTGANLSRALLQKSWLSGTKFQGSYLFETNFGIVPNLNICSDWNRNETPFKVEFHELSLYVGVCERHGESVKVVKSDIVTGNQILEFKLDSSQDIESTLRPGFFIFKDYIAIWGKGTHIHIFILDPVLTNPLIPVQKLKIPFPPDQSEKTIMELVDDIMMVQSGKSVRIFDFNPAVHDDTHDPILKFEKIFENYSKIQYISIDSIGFLFIEEWGDDNSLIQVICLDRDNSSNKIELQSIDLPYENGNVSFAVDPLNKQIAIAISDEYWENGKFEIRSLSLSAELIKDLTQSESEISAVQYSQDFKLLAAEKCSMTDHFIILYETSKWNLLREIYIGLHSLDCVGFGSIGNNDIFIAAMTLSQNITSTRLEVYDVRVRAELHEMSEKVVKKKQFKDIIVRTSVSIDGQLLAIELEGNAWVNGVVRCPSITPLQIWNLSFGRKIAEFEIVLTSQVELQFMSFVEGDKLLIIEKHSKYDMPKEYAVFYVWDKNSKRIRDKDVKREEINWGNKPGDFKKTAHFKVNQNGTVLARGLSDASIKLFMINNNDANLTHQIDLTSIVPRRREISIGNQILLSKILSMCFHPVRPAIALSVGTYNLRDESQEMQETMIRVWDISTGQLVAEFSDSHVYSMCFLGDGGTDNFNLKLISKSREELVVLNVPCVGSTKRKYDKHFMLKDFKPGSHFISEYVVNVDETERPGQAQGPHLSLLVTFNSENLLQLWSFPKRTPIVEIRFWFPISKIVFVPTLPSQSESVRLILNNHKNILCLECDINQNNWSILWSHCSDIDLNILDLNLNRCIGLDAVDCKLLTQNGAIGERACKHQKYISRSNVIQPVLGSSTLAPKSILSAIVQGQSSNAGQIVIDEDNWIVSAIENTTTLHVFLVLEGIEKGRRFLIESHLQFYKRENQVFFIMNAIEDLDGFRNEHQSCKVRQWNLKRDDGIQLIDNILKDYQTSLKYTKMKRNCIRWSKKKLQNIGFQFESRPWDWLVVLPSALLDRSTRSIP